MFAVDLAVYSSNSATCHFQVTSALLHCLGRSKAPQLDASGWVKWDGSCPTACHNCSNSCRMLLLGFVQWRDKAQITVTAWFRCLEEVCKQKILCHSQSCSQTLPMVILFGLLSCSCLSKGPLLSVPLKIVRNKCILWVLLLQWQEENWSPPSNQVVSCMPSEIGVNSSYTEN